MDDALADDTGDQILVVGHPLEPGELLHALHQLLLGTGSVIRQTKMPLVSSLVDPLHLGTDPDPDPYL